MADLGQALIDKVEASGADDLGSQIINRLQTASQLGDSSRVNSIPIMSRPTQGIERFARDGVDLDITSGAPFWKRVGLSFASTDEDRLARIRNAFKGSTVDIADDNFIVRNVLDEKTGKPKDLLVDEEGFNMKDIADLSSAGVQGLAEFALLKGLGRLKGMKDMGRLGRLTTESAAGAAGSEAVGGVTDFGQRLFDDQPLQLSEIALRRAKGAAMGTGTGMLIGSAIEAPAGTFDAITGKSTGALGPGETEKVGIQAIRRLNQDAPQQILPTVGQIAQNPDVMRFETVMSKMPIIGRLWREPLRQQDEALRALQRKQIGGEPLTPLGDLGLEAAETLRTIERQGADAAKGAETALITRATDELDTALTRMSPSVRPFTTEGVAALTKLTGRNQYKAFQKKADELFTAAGDPIIDTSAMRPELERIRVDLPKKTVVNESQLVDLQDKPLATTEGKEIIAELVPDKLNRLMRGLDQLDEQMPLSELRRIRNMVDSAIVDGRGLNEVSTYELKQLQGAITKTMNHGVAAIGDPKIAQALGRANKFYSEGIDRFEVPLISRLLKEDPNQPGFIRPFELLEAIKKNPDDYRDLERFMRTTVTEGGQAVAQSSVPQFNVLRRALTEEIFSRARIHPNATASTLDADAILRELSDLKPQVRASLLGGEAKTITRNLELLKQLKTGYKDVPEDALRNFLNRPNNSVHDLSALATAVTKERKLFENGLIKKFLKGDVGADQLPHEKIVDWLLNAKNSGEVSDFMAKIGSNPDLVEKIRRNYLFGFTQKNRAPLKSADAARLDDVSEILSPAKLTAALKDPTTRNNLRSILGDESFNFVRNFTEAQSVLGKQGDSGSATMGGIAATSALLDIFKMFKHPTSLGKHLLFSIAMTNPKVRAAIMDQSLKKPLNTADWTRAFISSAPVIEALAEDVGKTGVEFILDGFGLSDDKPKPQKPTP